ncbi:MAG: hypothetical protein CVU05_05765 [Bacteroidetes bacterium HGW-Bacteroidetes-21]|jgi:hypothetical protein|nr:MAG: hypothetical protein CVU05_05765 [Bacteroidetes bacterium HGW-Bacteroidetes-21]
MENSNKPRVLLKSKNMQVLMEYCIENKLEFTVIPRKMNDEWEIEINIADITSAIELGMFMRSNKLELVGNELFPKPKVVKPVVRKTSDKETLVFENETTKEKIPADNASDKSLKGVAENEMGLGLDFSEDLT